MRRGTTLPTAFVSGLLLSTVILSGSGAWASSLEEARELANAGNPEGAYRMGRLYEEGREVARDLELALRNYRAAAQRGHAEAQLSLGLLYTGAGGVVRRDAALAGKWFAKAARQGNATAQYFLGLAYEAGEGFDRDLARSFEWFRKASANGDARAMQGLARIYSGGQGVRRDLVKAYAWNLLAASRGYGDWKPMSEVLEARMTDAELERGRNIHGLLLTKYGGEKAARVRR